MSKCLVAHSPPYLADMRSSTIKCRPKQATAKACESGENGKPHYYRFANAQWAKHEIMIRPVKLIHLTESCFFVQWFFISAREQRQFQRRTKKNIYIDFFFRYVYSTQTNFYRRFCVSCLRFNSSPHQASAFERRKTIMIE